MKYLAFTVGDTPVPIPTVIQPIFNKAGLYGMNIIFFGITILLFVTIFLALAFLLYGGIMWVSSGGEKQKLQTARQTIIYALAGLIVAFFAFLIINTLGNFLAGTNYSVFSQ